MKLAWKVEKRYNEKDKLRLFKKGDKMLKQILPVQGEAKGKFTTNWKDPLIVKEVLPGRALVLTEMDKQVFPQPINSDMCKKFFI